MFKFQSWLSVNVVLLSMLMHTLSSASVEFPISSAIDSVDLGGACKFAILSKTGVTNTGPSDVGGNVGTSPIAATAITGLALSPTTAGDAEFSTSTFVTGNVYAASHLAPTPAMLTVAVSDMEAAYTDVSERPDPLETELFGGAFGSSEVLAPGIYKWGTPVVVPVGGTLTFDGSSTDKWIMQIAGNLVIGTNAKILLSGGAKAENIFWAVAGDIAFNVGSHAEGIFLTYTMIAMLTGSSLNGAAYAQTAVTLDSATIINDTTGPVLSGVPADTTVVCDNPPAVPVVTAAGCDSSLVVSSNEDKSAGNCATGYTLTRTWTAIDANGKIATESQTITVLATPVSIPTGDTFIGAFGDPHIKTWTGESYDFHGVCDLVLFSNPSFENGRGIDIHIRTKRMGMWSFIESTVIRIGKDKLELAGGNDNDTFLINGVVQKVKSKNGVVGSISGYDIKFIQVSKKSRKFVINLGTNHNNNKLEEVAFTTWNSFVSVNVKSPTKDHFDGSLGLMGTFEGGIKVARDGKTTFDDSDKFGQEWQVLSSEPQLFAQRGTVGPNDTCSSPSNVEMRRRLQGSVVTLEEAKIACGSVNKEMKDLCIFDVMATDDKSSAGAY